MSNRNAESRDPTYDATHEPKHDSTARPQVGIAASQVRIDAPKTVGASIEPAQDDPSAGVPVAIDRDAEADTPGRRVNAVAATAVIAVAFAACFSAYERVGTVANADTLETHLNGTSGFLGIGYSADQPGFVLLSRLDQQAVEVNVRQSINWLTGTHTVIRLTTPSRSARFRLRGPLAITIDEKGAVASAPVDWTAADFSAIRKAADCSVVDPEHLKFCGRPFYYMKKALADGPFQSVPTLVTRFLEDERLDERLVDWFKEHPEALVRSDHDHAHDRD